MFRFEMAFFIAIVAAASIPAFADGVAARSGSYADFPAARHGKVNGIGAPKAEDAGAFHSTLRRTYENGHDNLVTERGDRLAEYPTQQDDPRPLPEPGTGALLSIGLVWIVQFRSRPRRSSNSAPAAAKH